MRASGLTLAIGWGRYYRKYGFTFAFEWLTFAVVLALASVLIDERFRIVAVRLAHSRTMSRAVDIQVTVIHTFGCHCV